MMRMVWVLLLAGLAWCAWWWIAASSFERNLTGWFTQRHDEGWQADMSGLRRAGFPLVLEITLENPALADPDTGLAVQTTALVLRAPAYWPGDVTVTLPDDAASVATPNGSLALKAQRAQTDLRLHPGPALELEALTLQSGTWSISAPEGPLLSGASMSVTAIQSQTPEEYIVALSLPGLSPGALSRSTFRIPNDWPVTFETVDLDLAVTFDGVWDKRALEEQRPQPRQIHLRLADIAWGDLRIKAAGQLAVDDAGVPTGVVSLQAQNWQDILQLAETAGALPTVLRDQAERVLSGLAGASGNPNTLDIQLNFMRGWVALGFIPLGPAPRLILR